jgi:hypothetical protein
LWISANSAERCPELTNLVVHFLRAGHRLGNLRPEDLAISPTRPMSGYHDGGLGEA